MKLTDINFEDKCVIPQRVTKVSNDRTNVQNILRINNCRSDKLPPTYIINIQCYGVNIITKQIIMVNIQKTTLYPAYQ